MCMRCDDPELSFDEYLDRVIVPLVRQNGWAVQGVSGRRPFAYTVGLTDCGLPELVVTGMRDGPAATLLHSVAASALHAEPTAGERLVLPGGLTLEAVVVDRPQDHLSTALALYGDEVRALQLVWPDARGRYPWDRGHRAVRAGQPLLGRRARP